VLERARFDAAVVDEPIDVRRFEADHPAEAVGRHLSLIDEAIKGARRDAEPVGSVGRAEPANVVVRRRR